MEQMTKPTKPWLWKPGQSGNPNGRPPGARSQFSEAFLRDLRDGWQKHGKEVIDKVAKLEPTAFFATAARIIPKDVEITIGQQYPAGLDAEDLALLRAVKAALPNAGERSPADVFNHMLAALHAYDAKLIDDCTEKPPQDSTS